MKNFKEFLQEEMTTAGDAGIPQDTSNMGPKKRKRYPVTKRYIEVMGKMRKIEKSSKF
jgi:hypothetical protein